MKTSPNYSLRTVLKDLEIWECERKSPELRGETEEPKCRIFQREGSRGRETRRGGAPLFQ